MRRIVFVIGTRAEAIKILPVVRELEKRGHEVLVVSTGQHDLREFDFKNFAELNKPRGTSGAFNRVLEALPFLFNSTLKMRQYLRNSILIVHGDTMTTAAAAIAGKLTQGCMVCHLESGLRTGDLFQPFPEEFSRIIADAMASVHFAPTPRAAKVTGKKTTFLVGNTAIDAIKSRHLRVAKENFVLVSIHRQENIRRSDIMTRLVESVEKLASSSKIVWILPQNTRRKLDEYGLLNRVNRVADVRGVMPYEDFIKLLARAKAVVSDSGGLAEECSFLMKPLIIFREKTERQESVEQGFALLGFDFDLERFAKNFKPRTRYPYGTGDTAKKVVDVLEQLEGKKK